VQFIEGHSFKVFPCLPGAERYGLYFLVKCNYLDIGYNNGYTIIMKTAISLPDELYQVAERTAIQLGIPRSQLFAKALEEYINTHSKEKITKKLNELYQKEDSTIDRLLINAQIKVLSNADSSW